MQLVPQSFKDKARSGVRSHKWGISVSFDKSRNTSIGFFQLDVSQLDLGDLLSPSADNPVQFWDYFEYTPYDGRVVDMEWSREIEFPYSVTAAMADFTLNNHDNYFTPDKGSAIDQYILPKRPVRLYSGFQGETLLQQFVGLTERMPVIDSNSKTAQFHAMDFLAEMFTMPINRLIAMANVTTDEVLAAMFDQFGLDPSQYSLSEGRNRIPFVFFPKGKSTREALKEIMQAEGGQLWIDEQGIIRFRPRIVNDDYPVLTYDNSSTEKITLSGDDQIINTVRVTSDIRAVQPYQRVYASTDPETGSSAFTEPQTISASGTRFIEVSLDDPLISVDTPTIGKTLVDSWFTAIDGSDNPVTTNISVTLTRLNVNSYVMLFSNSNGFAVTIDNIEVWGEPAKVVDTIRYTARDTDSIEKYGEKVLEIDNDMFGSQSNAESFALTILNAYAEFNGTIEIEGKGNPALQLNDVITVDTREIQGQFKVISINTSMSGSKVTSRVKAIRVKFEDGQWFILDESLLDGPDILAP